MSCRRVLQLVIHILVLVGLSTAVGPAPAAAQSRLDEQFETGQEAFRNGQYADAVQYLSAVVQKQPDHRATNDAPAIYWLGRAHHAQGNSERARMLWRMGMYALANEGALAPALTDAYVRATFRQEVPNEFAPASRAYLQLLRQAGQGVFPGANPIARRHVAQMFFLLPDSTQARITHGIGSLREDEGELTADAGARLAAWWQRHNPTPATSVNERLVEHLQRVAEAERRFGDDSRRGFDDRGEIFVRLGAPEERRELESTSLAQSVSSRSAFAPQNEYWRYRAFGRHSHYLFVKTKGRYEIAGVTDLLPSSMRRGAGPSGALAALALYDYYNELVPRVPEYFTLFDEVDNTVAQLKRIASTHRTTVARLADSNFDPMSGRARLPGLERPFFQRARRVEREVAQIRERELPTVRSEVASPPSQLPVAVRTARFLRPDGSTRTEVYWAVAGNVLRNVPAANMRLLKRGQQLSDRQILQLTTTRYSGAYQAPQVKRSRLTVAANDTAAHVFGLTIPSSDTQHHVSLQWDQFLVPEGRALHDSTAWMPARSASYWADSLTALPAASDQLVLSDLVPLHAGRLQPGLAVRADTSFNVSPYPFRTLASNTKLAFYIEAYNLTFDASDQTQYTVTYEVRRRKTVEGLRELWASDTNTLTTASTSYSGSSRAAQEYVVLDLSQWDTADGSLRVTVRITDDVTGQTAARAATFTFAPPP